MKEKDLRKYHRITGMILAVFIIVQAGTGLIFTIGKMTGSSSGHDHVSRAEASSSESEGSEAHESLLSTVHYGGGMIGNIYRLLLAVAVIGQVSGGLLIYKNIRTRKKTKN